MALISTPTGAAVICGQCGTRFEFPPAYDRRLRISAAFAAVWGTARNDKGDFDYACPDCLVSRAVSSPTAVPDDPTAYVSADKDVPTHRVPIVKPSFDPLIWFSTSV
jgi:hypothetical protein